MVKIETLASPFIWERLAAETDAAWSAFCRYRDERRIPRPPVIEWVHEYDDLHLRTVQGWSARHKWLLRIKAYDDRRIPLVTGADARTRQEEVFRNEYVDYALLQKAWLSAFRKVHQAIDDAVDSEEMDKHIKNLNNLATARNRIQTIGRSSARLPKGYSVRVNSEIDEEERNEGGPIVLDAETGPRREGEQG